MHIDEKCNPTRYEVFTTDFQATSGLSGLNYVDEISKGVISASDEYYSLYNTSKFDTDFVRQRALANIAENRDLKWYTNLIGITYAADRKKLTDEKNSRKLLEKALFWFTESLKYDKTFFPAMANKIDAEIILDNYSDNSFDAGAKELLNTYYMYPGKGYIGYAGILYYEEVFGINGGNVTINKQKLNKIQLSRDFIEREISLYGGNSDLYGTLSRIYGFFGKADTKEKYDYLIKSQSSSRRL
ncbi:hypothetical protein Mesop_2261 [Mesorhizobium opportunistum WSM2075]|uniref:Uncharacterized protein n=1 Tax=Mesorhizobium opportunistum (strain LMG 24607 / HAMBI 3007 / WSM2075) TaxID=536019 RepID=F7YDE1_MESOW|nr:hypothetical protein Mesop_2261 [Mesorhizobium opportunistum WSM2075]